MILNFIGTVNIYFIMNLFWLQMLATLCFLYYFLDFNCFGSFYQGILKFSGIIDFFTIFFSKPIILSLFMEKIILMNRWVCFLAGQFFQSKCHFYFSLGKFMFLLKIIIYSFEK